MLRCISVLRAMSDTPDCGASRLRHLLDVLTIWGALMVAKLYDSDTVSAVFIYLRVRRQRSVPPYLIDAGESW